MLVTGLLCARCCVQVRVGKFVYVCSTGDGAILQLSYPDMQLVRRASSSCCQARQHSTSACMRVTCD